MHSLANNTPTRPESTVSRWLFCPLHIKGGIINWQHTFEFASGATYESVNSHDVLTREELQVRGKAEEDRKNQGRLVANKLPLEYSGLIEAICAAITSIVVEGYKFEIRHNPINEDGIINEAHCDLILIEPANKSRPAKALAKQKLADCFNNFFPLLKQA